MHKSKKIKRESWEILNLLTRSSASGSSAADLPVIRTEPEPLVSNVQCEELEDSCEDIFSDSEDNCSVTDGDMRPTMLELKFELSNWVVQHNITNSAVNDLLKLLKKYFTGLPLDARTLKSTPKQAPLKKMDNGEYVHYGVEDALTDFLSKTRHVNRVLELNINIDGLPLAKSSNLQIWPILINVNKSPDVIVVGAYCGKSKAENASYFLQEFVNELSSLINNGINFQGELYTVICRAFICDAPARSFILGIKGHTGYSSCLKCTQKGEAGDHKIIFQYEENNCLRTDAEFRSRSDTNHHKIMEKMSIENLPINIVDSFPNDYMHVVCLGVTKTLLLAWIKKRNQAYSMTKEQIQFLDEKLLFINNQIPRDFARRTRSVKEIERYKATEFRLFLLYTGIFVLKDILDPVRYAHFLQLSLGIRILLTENDCITNNFCANQLLIQFVKRMPELYNESFLTFNFHCLMHLAKDTSHFGPMDTFSAFKFENYLSKLKKKIRKNHQVAAQVYNRLVEESIYMQKVSKPVLEIERGKLINGALRFIKIKNTYFSAKAPDNLYSVHNKIYLLVTIDDCVKLHGKEILNLTDFFTQPIISSKLGIRCSAVLEYSNETVQHTTNEVSKKIVMFYNAKSNLYVFISMINFTN